MNEHLDRENLGQPLSIKPLASNERLWLMGSRALQRRFI